MNETLANRVVLTFTPDSYSYLGAHNITLNLTDQQGLQNVKSFFMTVTNKAPKFLTTPEPVLHIHLNQNYYYKLPTIYDAEDQPVTVSLISGAESFMSIEGNSHLKVSTNGLSGLATYSAVLNVSDGSPKDFSLYKMSLIIGNCAPEIVTPVAD